MVPDESAYLAEAMGYRPALLSAAYRLTRNPTDAEDLVQETYLKAHKSCDSFQGHQLRAWLNRILANTFVNAYHARRRRPEVLGLADHESWQPVDAGLVPAEVVLASTPDQDLTAALAALPPEFRRVLLLADVDGYSYREIAAIVEIPIGTVMSRLSRARRNLRTALASG